MTQQLLLDCTLASLADLLLEQLSPKKHRAKPLHLWLFEDQLGRRKLAAQLAENGIEARVHSAYKPLVHFFLEEVNPEGLTSINISYPVNAAWPEQRFRLEAYPLAGLYPDVTLTFSQHVATPEGTLANASYQVELHYGTRRETHEVFAPNRLRRDFLGYTNCVPSAWLTTFESGKAVHSPLKSEYQQCYNAVIKTVSEHSWTNTTPYFDRLVIRARLPGIERRLPIGHETISTSEALHEDIYFSLLEFFQRHSGLKMGDRSLQPGQIIPEIMLSDDGSASVKVYYEPTTNDPLPTKQATSTNIDTAFNIAQLANSAAPLTHQHIQQALADFTGSAFNFPSRQGRSVSGVHLRGNAAAVFISGGQHANETSGVIGALRGADILRHDNDAHLVLMPLENPDGYALGEALRASNPQHIHHAARYSALGDDIEYRRRPPWFERAARDHVFATSGARLHLNLHGYPAHEWTRPSTGYLPRGFELWGIPKGFFLILRYRPEAQTRARALLTHVIDQLSQNSALMAHNNQQLEIYRQHANTLPFELLKSIPYMESQVDNMPCDITLITEFPDETLYGEAFMLAHSVQTETVVAATRWWWQNS